MSLLKSSRGQNFFLLFASIILAFILGEIYLRLNPPVSVYMPRRNIVQQTHSELSPNPLLGYIPRAGLVKPFSNHEFTVTVRINSFNLRDREYPLEKPPGIRRIAVMGDSFVFGWGVENQEVFTEILESEILKNTEVLNFGVSGYATYQELERLKTEGLRFHPDIVLFFVYSFPEGYPVGPEEDFLIRDGVLHPEMPPLSLKRKISMFLERHFYLYTLWQETRGTLSTLLAPPYALETPAEKKQRIDGGLDILQQFKDLGGQNGFIPIVVFFPVKQAAKEGVEPEEVPVRKFCLQHSIHYLDLTQPLHELWQNQHISPYFRIDDHWNRDGHRLVAGILSKYLNDNGFLSEGI